VKEGEVVGIIGRNGAGKSTLLKILSKITYPTLGQVAVHGHVASLLEVGTGFHEELTGRENIYLNGSILGMTRRQVEERMDAIIAFADVEKFIDTPIKRYSSGMRLRLGFAVAAHLDPDVLMVDEVLAVGDVGFQRKCLKAIDDLRGSGRTVLFVSHNMAAVENLCSRAVWIDAGRVRQDGNVKEVIGNYMSSFTRAQERAGDLRHIERNGGSGEIRYTGIEFLDVTRKPVRVVRSGDKLVVRLHYHAARHMRNLVVFGFRIFTELGTLVTDVSTGCTGTDISNLVPGEGYVDVEIDFLNLMPSRYSLSLWLHNDGGIVYDVLEHCAMVDVEVSNYFGSGKGIDSRNGIIFLPFRWNLDGLGKPRACGNHLSDVNEQ
jgi:lipopolysaccharide transport system ATP-binding protein